jgi:hypothetical protein
MLIGAARTRVVMFQLFRQINWLRYWKVEIYGLNTPSGKTGKNSRCKNPLIRKLVIRLKILR